MVKCLVAADVGPSIKCVDDLGLRAEERRTRSSLCGHWVPTINRNPYCRLAFLFGDFI